MQNAKINNFRYSLFKYLILNNADYNCNKVSNNIKNYVMVSVFLIDGMLLLKNSGYSCKSGRQDPL